MTFSCSTGISAVRMFDRPRDVCSNTNGCADRLLQLSQMRPHMRSMKGMSRPLLNLRTE